MPTSDLMSKLGLEETDQLLKSLDRHHQGLLQRTQRQQSTQNPPVPTTPLASPSRTPSPKSFTSTPNMASSSRPAPGYPTITGTPYTAQGKQEERDQSEQAARTPINNLPSDRSNSGRKQSPTDAPAVHRITPRQQKILNFAPPATLPSPSPIFGKEQLAEKRTQPWPKQLEKKSSKKISQAYQPQQQERAEKQVRAAIAKRATQLSVTEIRKWDELVKTDKKHMESILQEVNEHSHLAKSARVELTKSYELAQKFEMITKAPFPWEQSLTRKTLKEKKQATMRVTNLCEQIKAALDHVTRIANEPQHKRSTQSSRAKHFIFKAKKTKQVTTKRAKNSTTEQPRAWR